MAANPSGPDISMLKDQKLPAADFPGEQSAAFRIFLDASAHRDIRQHATADVGVEICGVLVGQWRRDQRGPYVAITHSIRGDAAANKAAEVTFTHETWAKINQRMDKEFTDSCIVGWYHTHPDFGIFLSDRDRFIHEHFFSGPGQVAYVVDPVRGEDGMFYWAAGKPKRSPYFWIGDDFRIAADTSDEKNLRHEERPDRPSARQGLAGLPAPSSPPPPPPPQPMFSLVSEGTLLLLSAVGLFLLGYFVAPRLSGWEQQKIIEGTVYDYGTLKAMNLGLSDNLYRLSTALGQAREEMMKLGESEAASKSLTPEGQAAFEATIDHMTQIMSYADLIATQYTLSPAEKDAYENYVNQKSLSIKGNAINPAEPPSTQPSTPSTPPTPSTPSTPASTRQSATRP